MLTENQNNNEWETILQNKRIDRELKEEPLFNPREMNLREFENGINVTHREKIWSGITLGEFDIENVLLGTFCKSTPCEC